MKWFKEVFLPSFGTCKDRRISEKQAEIFKRYMNGTISENECSDTYTDKVDGKQITLTDSIEWAGWKNGKPMKTHRYYLCIE